jgi:hypothetical protein
MNQNRATLDGDERPEVGEWVSFTKGKRTLAGQVVKFRHAFTADDYNTGSRVFFPEVWRLRAMDGRRFTLIVTNEGTNVRGGWGYVD